MRLSHMFGVAALLGAGALTPSAMNAQEWNAVALSVYRAVPSAGATQDTVPRRRAAIAYSDGYGRRATLHRYASYAIVPLFAAQYVLGSRILSQKEDLFANRRFTAIDEGLVTSHRVVAGGVGAVFLFNTTTGVWNLIEGRRDPSGRGRRRLHALAMLAADAGFVATGVMGARATKGGPATSRTHRNVALTSVGIATAGASLMWFGQDN